MLKKGELWMRGEWDVGLFEKCAAVVGSRRMTEYGRRVTENLVTQLVSQGYTIVSGFMYGIDRCAHTKAIDVGGRTIAVLGWGIEHERPADERRELQRIVDAKGLILSQWQDQVPTTWTFPARNKVVAEIAHEVYVVEAAARSGALITVDLATKMGKKIWSVPGPVTSKSSEGTNTLIKTGKAEMWLPDVVTKSAKTRCNKNADIYRLVQFDIYTCDEIARLVNRPVDEVGAELTMMMLAGDIVEKDGKYYVGQS